MNKEESNKIMQTVSGDIFTSDQVNVMKEAMRNQGIKVEFDLMKEISLYGEGFGVGDLVKVYMEQLKATTTNKFGVKEPDNKARLTAANQILKLMTGNNSNLSKTNITINTQNNVWGGDVDTSSGIKF